MHVDYKHMKRQKGKQHLAFHPSKLRKHEPKKKKRKHDPVLARLWGSLIRCWQKCKLTQPFCRKCGSL